MLGRYPTLAAAMWFAIVGLTLTAPALLGYAALGPDRVIDADPLYGSGAPRPLPPFRDPSRAMIELPRDLAIAHGLAAGRIPKWNPLSGGGAPLWAEEGGPFFPLKLPFYLAPSLRTFELFIALRPVFGGLGAYLLARRRGLSALAAIGAGTAFQLSGASIAQFGFGNFSAYCVLPWALLGAYAIASTGSGRAAAAAAVALGVAGCGGHPTTVALVFGTFSVATVGHMMTAWREPRRVVRTAALAAVAAQLGVALAAPTHLPLAELAAFGSSYKARGIASFMRLLSIYEGRSAATVALFAPGLLPVALASAQRMLLFSVTIGFLGLVVAIAGLLRRGIDLPLACVGLSGIVLASVPPGFAWVKVLPGVKSITPEYAWILVVVPLTQALGRGIEVLSATSGRRVAGLALLIAGAGSMTLLLLPPIGPSMIRTDFHAIVRRAAADPVGLMRLLVPPAFAVIALAACALLQRSRRPQAAAIGLVVALVVEQLCVMLPVVRQPTSSVLASPPSDAVRFLQEHLADGNGRFVGVPFSVGHPLTPMLFGLADLRGLSGVPIERYRAFLKLLSNKAGDFTFQGVPSSDSPLLDVAAVRYVAVAADAVAGAEPPGGADAVPAYQDDRVAIYAHPSALPRVRIVHEFLPVQDVQQAQNALRSFATVSPDAQPRRLAETVVLERDEEGQWPPRLDGGTADGDAVQIVEQDDGDRVQLHVRTQAPGLVVVADTYYPGWVARVDGRRTPIYPANVMFRAVFVPSGEHTVELHYEPASFLWGMRLFAVALLGTVLLAARSRRGRGW